MLRRKGKSARLVVKTKRGYLDMYMYIWPPVEYYAEKNVLWDFNFKESRMSFCLGAQQGVNHKNHT